jgi:hypothetical protein
MQKDLHRPQWSQAWAAWAKEQSRQLDWEHRLEMRRRIFVRAATNGDQRLRDSLFTLIATAHSIGEEMSKRQASAEGLTDRDIEFLASNILAVMSTVPAPMQFSDEEIPF